MNKPENILQNARDAVAENFVAKYGIDSNAANALYRDGNSLVPMLQHMYFEAMEELRECDLDKDGKRIQGQAQVLWTLLNIPKDLEEMKELDT